MCENRNLHKCCFLLDRQSSLWLRGNQEVLHDVSCHIWNKYWSHTSNTSCFISNSPSYLSLRHFVARKWRIYSNSFRVSISGFPTILLSICCVCSWCASFASVSTFWYFFSEIGISFTALSVHDPNPLLMILLMMMSYPMVLDMAIIARVDIQLSGDLRRSSGGPRRYIDRRSVGDDCSPVRAVSTMCRSGYYRMPDVSVA